MKTLISALAIVLVTASLAYAAPQSQPKNSPPSASEWGKLRSYLAQSGWSQQDIKDCIGSNINGRERQEIINALKGCIAEK